MLPPARFTVAAPPTTPPARPIRVAPSGRRQGVARYGWTCASCTPGLGASVYSYATPALAADAGRYHLTTRHGGQRAGS